MIYKTEELNLKNCNHFAAETGGKIYEINGDRGKVVVQCQGRGEYVTCEKLEKSFAVVIDSDIKGLRMERK